MSVVQIEQEKTKSLVRKVAEEDSCEAFGELEWLAKPLMTHLADYYCSLHYKFEFEDFYAICLNALYEACLEYNPKNPSFLSYSKTFMVNQCNRELEYWNAEMRNIFTTQEIMVGLEREINTKDSLVQFITVEDEVSKNEFRRNIKQIISYAFDDDKAEIMRLYIMNDMRPVDIAELKGMEYQSTYSIIKRGMKKIANEYKSRYSLDIISIV
jgi:RNA polymerase sigma factor (sigma-70 family)